MGGLLHNECSSINPVEFESNKKRKYKTIQVFGV